MGWIATSASEISQDTLDHLFQLKMGRAAKVESKNRISLYQSRAKIGRKTIRFDDAEGMLEQKNSNKTVKGTILEQVLAVPQALFPVQINDELLDQQVVVSAQTSYTSSQPTCRRSPLGGAPKR